MVIKPYDSSEKRGRRAVAIGKLIMAVLAPTGEDADHPTAKIRIGIDTGKALAVNNGRRGHREPLFLGVLANHAAKRAGGDAATGIYLTNRPRKAIGLAEAQNEDQSPLTVAEIQTQVDKADLGVSIDSIVNDWKENLKANPIGKFDFKFHTPPYSNLDIESLSPANSRRQAAGTVYADLDGFTNYVAENITSNQSAKHVVRTLHVLRSELDAVLQTDFAGLKVRFIGDCVHGLTVEGTPQNTEVEETIANLTLCAAAMRSSFELALERLKAKGSEANLGLAIGFDFGPMTVTRLGMKGEMIRCSWALAGLVFCPRCPDREPQTRSSTSRGRTPRRPRTSSCPAVTLCRPRRDRPLDAARRRWWPEHGSIRPTNRRSDVSRLGR